VTQDRDVQNALPLKPAHFHILLSLAPGPMHAYGVRHDVEQRTNGRIVLAAGTLYETFQRMESKAWVEETKPPTDPDGPVSSRWRFYQITDFGRKILEAEVERLETDLAAARRTIQPAG